MTKLAEVLYPGPIPLQETHVDRLYGRNEALDELVGALHQRRVVELSAPSGSGKSSLLRAGLIPRLEGCTVGALHEWSAVQGRGAEHYASAVREAFRQSGVQIDWTADFVADLDALVERSAGLVVIVFDQFEELLRLDRTAGRDFLNAVAAAAKRWPIRQVLSLRSEYKEELRHLEARLSRATWTWFRVEDIADEDIADVVINPAEAAGYWLTDKAVERFRDIWVKARQKDADYGLLHFQALLRLVMRQVAPVEGEPLGLEDLTARSAFFRDFAAADSDETVVLGQALQAYVEARLDEFTEDEFAVEVRESRYACARWSRQLYSGDYKASKDAAQLFDAAFPDLRWLKWEPTVVAHVRDLAARGEFAVVEPTVSALLARARAEGLDDGSFGEGADGTMLAGRLAGMPPLEALVNLVVAFERGLRWFVQTGLARVTHMDGRREVTLVHDGYARALRQWAESKLASPRAVLESLTGINGEEPFGTATEISSEEFPDPIMNLRMPGCGFAGTYVGVTFSGGDFRGAVFEDCDLRGVTFLDCDLSGALFLFSRLDACEVEGGTFRTLTFRESSLGPDGVVLKDVSGYGLFLDQSKGGRWRIESCKEIRHVAVTSTDAESSRGEVVDSQLLYVDLQGLPPDSVTVSAGSSLRHVDANLRETCLVSEDSRVQWCEE